MHILALSEIAREVDAAFMFFAVSCGVMMAGIVLVMIVLILRFHRSNSPRIEQVHGHTVMEICWIVIPTLIVIYMFFVGFKGFRLMRHVPEDHMVVEVMGQQWQWSFYYPDFDITTTNDEGLYLPGGRAVKFIVRSPKSDVLHSFYLPDFRVKEDAVPDTDHYMWIQPDMPEPGEKPEYNIFCAEFCGTDHSKMISHLTVLRPEEFKQWVADFKAKVNAPIDVQAAMDPQSDMILNINAEKLFKANCIACHGAGGHGEEESRYVNARNFTSLEDWKQGTKKSDIFRTLANGIPETNMRSFKQLSLQDRFALMHYVAHFYGGDDRPVDTPEDLAQLNLEFKLDQERTPRESIPVEEAMERLAGPAGAASRTLSSAATVN